MSGLPVNVLFRLAVQSINGLQNTRALDTSGRDGTPEFFELLINLRGLQVGNLLDLRLAPGVRPVNPSSNVSGRLLLTLAYTWNQALQSVVARTRRLLGMRLSEREVEVLYGRGLRPGQIAMLTRPILGILAQVGSKAKVSEENGRLGKTVGSLGFVKLLRRPAIIIRSAYSKPTASLVQIIHDKRWFWISEDDFDSKLAFTVVQPLLAISQTLTTPGALVAIPTR